VVQLVSPLLLSPSNDVPTVLLLPLPNEGPARAKIFCFSEPVHQNLDIISQLHGLQFSLMSWAPVSEGATSLCSSSISSTCPSFVGELATAARSREGSLTKSLGSLADVKDISTGVLGLGCLSKILSPLARHSVASHPATRG